MAVDLSKLSRADLYKVTLKGKVATFSELHGYIMNAHCSNWKKDEQGKPVCSAPYWAEWHTDKPDGTPYHSPECERTRGRGYTVTKDLVVAEIIAWADNSTEAISVPDETGKVWRQMLEYPHGDVCF